MQTTNFNNGIEAIEKLINQDWVDNVKATKVTYGSFNDMEGYQVAINIKVTGKALPDGCKYKNRLFRILTNSTYTEEIEGLNNEDPQAFNEYISNLYAL